jgi:hypothetical protein
MMGVSVFMQSLSIVAGFFLHLALEVVEPFPDEGEKGVAFHGEVVRGDDGFVNFLDQNFLACGLGERRVGFLEKAALAGNGLDDALAFEFGIGLGDGVAVDAQFLGERADGGQRFAGAQPAGGRRVTDLVHQLQIDRLAGFKIELQEHTR